MSRPTTVRLVDVAERARVSLATASRILNSPGNYRGRREHRERVEAAAAELGYQPNLHARALAGSTSSSVALVVHDIRDAYFARIAGAVVRAAEQHGLLVTIVSTDRDPQQEARYLALLRAQRPRAIIMAGSGFTTRSAADPIAAELRQFEAAGGVVVSLGQQKVGHGIVVGNEEGARSLAHALVGLGHTSFALVTGPARMNTVRDRVAGFTRGLAEHGVALDPDYVFFGEGTREYGAEIARHLTTTPHPPTCVFGTFDVVAVGLVAGFRSAGWSVPSDVSVAGFADVPVASDITPSLTTVRLPLDLVGTQAVELALGPEPSVRRSVSFEGPVVMRESTAPPKGLTTSPAIGQAGSAEPRREGTPRPAR